MTMRDGLGRGGIALLLVASVLSSREAEATTTRVYTLGVMNRFVLDDTNRWLYPHIITKYGSLFYLELFGAAPSEGASAPGSLRQTASAAPGQFGTLSIADTVPVQSTAGGGAIVAITDDLFVSLHLSDFQNPTVPTFLGLIAGASRGDPRAFAWLPIPPDTPAAANRKFDVFLAYNLQDIAQLGLLFTFGSSRYVRNANDNDPEVQADLMGGTERRNSDSIGTSELGVLLGGGIEVGDVASVDVGLGVTLHGLTYRPNQRGSLLDGGGGVAFQADVRSMIGVSESWEVVPALSFRLTSLSGADLADFANGLFYNDDVGRERYFITDVRAKQLVLDLGVAGHLKASERIHFWMGTGVQVARFSAEFENAIQDAPMAGLVRDEPLEFSRDSVTVDALPYLRLALEAGVFSWLDFRAGVVKFVRADTVKEDKVDDNNANNNRLNDVTEDFPFFDFFVGFAAHHEGFFLDVQMDPFWFMRGPEFLSGASGSGGGNMFANASLGYRF